ncbi:hypothetical protein JHK87_037875 [Glycine soja]|nr:hypothetical protein JHK87_037875 [Glycine soja]
MRFVAIALVLMLACCCCMGSDRWRNIEAKMHGKNKQVSRENNDHHSIPLKDYGKPGSGHHDVTAADDNNDHHYIPRKDFGKHGSAQFHVTDDHNKYHCIANSNYNKDDRGCYGEPGGGTKVNPGHW